MPSSTIRSATSREGLKYVACGPTDSAITVIFVHGWGCQGSDYKYLFQELAEQEFEYQTIAVDLPGHGRTTKESCPDPNIFTFAAKISALVEELRLNNIMLVGHSMGCRIILETWSRGYWNGGKPACSGVVFLDGSHYGLRPGLFAFDKGDPRSKDLGDDEIAAYKEEVFKRMFTDETPEEFEVSTLAHVKAMDKDYSSNLREQFVDYDLRSLEIGLMNLGLSGTPLLNLQSTDVDPNNKRVQLKTGQISKWMALVETKVPQASQFIVEDSGHFPHVDQPEDVSRRLVQFVEEATKRDFDD